VPVCLKLRAADWRVIFTSSAELYHHESASVGRHAAAARR
jgi:GT2 family glycosyltransferase